MATLFVSHASEDKSRIEPIVLRLLDRLSPSKHELWIDKPQRVSNDPRLASARAIEYGSSWADAIANALDEQSCLVLFVWSGNTARRMKPGGEDKRGSLAWEMHRAIEKDAFIGARLEGISQDLPDAARKLHWCDLRDWRADTYHAEFEKLLTSILGKLAELDRRSDNSAIEHAGKIERGNGRGKDALSGDLLLQYVDRHRQELALRGLARKILTAGEPRPLAIVGPENEEPQAFLKRAFRSAGELVGDDGLLQFRLDWPHGEGDFRDVYRGQISLEIERHPDLAVGEIARKLAAFRQMVVFWSLISSERWSANERARLIEWARFWSEVKNQNVGKIRVLPLVCIKLPATEQAWYDPASAQSLPPQRSGARGPAPVQLWSELKAVEQALAHDTPFCAPMLAPILEDEAEAWLARPDVALDGAHPRSREAQAKLKSLFAETKRPALGFLKKLPPQSPIRSFSDAMHDFIES